MKVGDLVRHKTITHLGVGLITCDEPRFRGVSNGDPWKGYVWVTFQGWTENDKWCEIKNLELVSGISPLKLEKNNDD